MIQRFKKAVPCPPKKNPPCGWIWLNLDSHCPNRVGYEFSLDEVSWKRVKDERDWDGFSKLTSA
jgi:hypothetical protein